jgi:SAM-dependent methyltransferase
MAGARTGGRGRVSGPVPFVFEEGGAAKRFAPATERNRDAIAAVLKDVLPSSGLILEIASGTGEHIVHFAKVFPDLAWQPSDPDPAALASITAWQSEVQLQNLRPPVRIDAALDWEIVRADAITCINMVHISPWPATLGLLRNASRILARGAPLYLYGPYIQEGVSTAASNLEFDESLKSRNPEWGLRSVEAVEDVARTVGLDLIQLIPMSANNLSLVFRRTAEI